MTIKERVTAHGIKHLMHFTRAENVDEILKYGLIPRTQFDKLSSAPVVNDEMRLDYCLGATSVSISFPNYKMFYRYRMENAGTTWAVVVLDTSVLWKNTCAFCVENAAKNSVSMIPVDERAGVAAFDRMFAEIEGKPTRAAMRLPEYYPTHPQAEVLVFGTIEPRFIIGAAYNQDDLVAAAKMRNPKHQFKNLRNLFDARIDYQHWR